MDLVTSYIFVVLSGTRCILTPFGLFQLNEDQLDYLENLVLQVDPDLVLIYSKIERIRPITLRTVATIHYLSIPAQYGTLNEGVERQRFFDRNQHIGDKQYGSDRETYILDQLIKMHANKALNLIPIIHYHQLSKLTGGARNLFYKLIDKERLQSYFLNRKAGNFRGILFAEVDSYTRVKFWRALDDEDDKSKYWEMLLPEEKAAIVGSEESYVTDILDTLVLQVV